MAFPSFEGALATEFAAETTSHVVDLPESVSAGDLLLLAFTTRETTISTPSGWTEVFKLGFGFPSGNAALFYKIADGSEGGTTVDVATTNARAAVAHVLHVWRWFGVSTGFVISVNGSGLDPPNLNPALWDVEDTLWIAGCHCTDDDAVVTGFPSGYSNALGSVTGAGTDHGATVGTCSKESAAASENPGTFAIDDAIENKLSWVLAIRPGSSGSGPEEPTTTTEEPTTTTEEPTTTTEEPTTTTEEPGTTTTGEPYVGGVSLYYQIMGPR